MDRRLRSGGPCPYQGAEAGHRGYHAAAATQRARQGNGVWRDLMDAVRRRADVPVSMVSDEYLLHAMRRHLYGTPPDERHQEQIIRATVRRLRMAIAGPP